MSLSATASPPIVFVGSATFWANCIGRIAFHIYARGTILHPGTYRQRKTIGYNDHESVCTLCCTIEHLCKDLKISAMTITKPNNKITFRDLLSHLNFETAAKLLGPDGRRLIMAGAKREIDIRKHVVMSEDSLQVTFPEANSRQPIQAAVIFDNHSRDRLRFTCSECEEVCEHIGAMTSMILESKTPLGLAAPPKERKSVDSLSEPQLVAWRYWSASCVRKRNA